MGEWKPIGRSNEPTGGFRFSMQALGRVILRTNFADYPATTERPPFQQEGAIVIYVDEAQALHVEFIVSEGQFYSK
jgi:hypothetical protein